MTPVVMMMRAGRIHVTTPLLTLLVPQHTLWSPLVH